MAKRKKKSNKAVKTLLFILISIFILVWTLVACGGLPFPLDEKSSYDKEEDPSGPEVQEPSQEETQSVSEEEASVTEEEPVTTQDASSTEEVTTTTEQEPTEASGQGSDEEDSFDSNIDGESLSGESYGWSWKRNSEHLPPEAYNQGIDLEQYGTYYKVDTEEKVVYLTFDEGYENGYTSQILDILLQNEVQATFFVTKPYITSNADLCIRMKAEGHLVGNHSVTHRSFPTLTDEEIEQELKDTAQAFSDVTGYEIDTFFRPPSGNYSEKVLYNVRKAGYRTIFWSLGYGDWDAKNQPGRDFAYEHIMENYHPGGIFLLHAVSQSTTEALEEVIKALKAEGYRFGNLYEVE